MIRVLCWLWSQDRTIYRYTPDDVNVWAAMVRRNLTIPHRLACVTNTPNGIDSSVEILPLPEAAVESSRWPSSKGLPQCLRRLDLWRPDAAEIYGERIVSMDLDCVVTASLDPLFDRGEDVLLLSGNDAKRPYNGSLLMLKAGARPEVFETITPEGIETATRYYLGSDQAWIAYVLGPNEVTWGEADGVYKFNTRRFPAPVRNKRNAARGQRVFPSVNLMNPELPSGMRVLFFPGAYKPRDLKASYPFIREHYR